MVLLWVVPLMLCPQRLLPASVLQLLSVAQSSSRSLTAIAAHPLCRAVSSLEGGRGRPPEQCREREKKSRGCARRVFARRLPQQASAAACRRAAGKQLIQCLRQGIGSRPRELPKVGRCADLRSGRVRRLSRTRCSATSTTTSRG